MKYFFLKYPLPNQITYPSTWGYFMDDLRVI